MRAAGHDVPWVDAYWPAPRFRAPLVLFKRAKQLYFYINDPLLR